MLLKYHDWTTVTVSFMVFQNGNWTNFKEFKTLQHALLLKLNNRITLAASWITYNIQSYSYYFQDSSWTFSGLFVRIYKNIIHLVVYIHPPNHFLLSPLWILCHTVNVLFSSVHLQYGILLPILLKMQPPFRPLNLL